MNSEISNDCKNNKRASQQDFFDSEENQKKYGFTVEYRDGIRCIFYDGDMDILLDAAYGPAIETDSCDFGECNTMELSLSESGQLHAQLPGEEMEVNVDVKLLSDGCTEPNFALCRKDNDTVLSRFSLVDPEYYPDEKACLYLLNLRGLTILNDYIIEHHTRLLNEWNLLHPDAITNLNIPIPNYRFLARILGK